MLKFLTLPELDTKSVLNVVEDNFRKLNLKAYAIRMIYIGEHALPKEEIIQHFSRSIELVNSTYCEINVYGLLLVYDSYFVHILEGSEDTIHRHLRFLFRRETNWKAKRSNLDQPINVDSETEFLNIIMADNTEAEDVPERIMFRRLKLVMIYHSIRTLLFTKWRAVTARPPSLIGKLDLFGTLQDHLEQLRIFLNKLTKICAFAKADENLSFEGLKVVDPKMEALPEVALIDFLLQSPHILPLRETAALHRQVEDFKFYFEEVWPLPTQFTPRFLYKLKIDDSFVEPLPVMPWEVVKKEGDDEERDEREEHTDSSSD